MKRPLILLTPNSAKLTCAAHLPHRKLRLPRRPRRRRSHRRSSPQLRSRTRASPAEADVVIVNTCSVTAEADREARAYIRRTHRLNPEARIIATGCYAQRAPEELAAIPGVSAVIGNSHKALAPEIALQLALASSAEFGFRSCRRRERT